MRGGNNTRRPASEHNGAVYAHLQVDVWALEENLVELEEIQTSKFGRLFYKKAVYERQSGKVSKRKSLPLSY